jgi:tetratricopeptide (TPR) repeat protein
MLTAVAQNQPIDTLIQKIAIEKNDDLRFELENDFFSNTAETNPMLELKNAQKLLVYSQNHKDKLSEAFALCRIGYSYRIFGNTEKFLEYLLKANDLAKETKNGRTIAFISQVLGHVYKDQSDFAKAFSYYKITEEIGERLKYDKALAWAYGNLSDVYLGINVFTKRI